MTVFTKTAVDIFAAQDSSGAKRKVANHDVQVWGTEVERALAAFQAGGGIIFETKAEADSNLNYAANTMAWVLGDPVASNNGIYQKDGASGSGSWQRLGDLPYSFILATNSGTGTADAIQATTVIPIPAVDGGALIALPIVADNTASPVTVSFNGDPALTIKTIAGNDVPASALASGMTVWGFKSGDEFRLVTDLSSAGILAGAEAAAEAAENAADRAQSYSAMLSADKVKFATVADLLADETMSYTPGAGLIEVGPGDIIEAQGFRYEVAASDATDEHVETAGGVKLYVVREVGGTYSTASFGVVGDGIADDTVPMQRCLDAAGQYGIVIVDRVPKAIRVTDTLVVPNALTLKGDCHSVANPSPREDAPIIWLDYPTGGKPLFQAGAGGLQLEGVWLFGLDPSTPIGTVAMPAGSTAVKSSGVVKTVGMNIMSFDVAIEATGGYYHKHDGIIVRHCKTIFKNADAYNFHVSQGRFTDFDQCFVSVGGTGPITFTQCSFEKWTTYLFGHLSSGRQKVTLDHCYVENYPGTAVAAGLSTSNSSNYDRALGFSGGISVSIRDSNIQLKGVRRWVFNDGNTEKITVSDGNTYWLYAPGAAGQTENTEFLFYLTNNKVFKTNDLIMFINPDGSVVDYSSWTGTTAYKNADVNLTGTWDWFGFDFIRHIGPLPTSATGLKAGTMYNNSGTVSVAS